MLNYPSLFTFNRALSSKNMKWIIIRFNVSINSQPFIYAKYEGTALSFAHSELDMEAAILFFIPSQMYQGEHNKILHGDIFFRIKQ